jgi:hypothetical protein
VRKGCADTQSARVVSRGECVDGGLAVRNGCADTQSARVVSRGECVDGGLAVRNLGCGDMHSARDVGQGDEYIHGGHAESMRARRLLAEEFAIIA